MYQKKSSITIKTIKYKLIFCDTQALLIFIQSNINYKKSLIEIMKKGTDKYFDILNLVIKNYSEPVPGTPVRPGARPVPPPCPQPRDPGIKGSARGLAIPPAPQVRCRRI